MRFAPMFCAIMMIFSLVTACSHPEAALLNKVTDHYLCESVGEMTNGKMQEVSGVAQSKRQDHLLWMINDSGDDAVLYAVNTAGKLLSAVNIQNAENVDWEDMASFVFDGRPYLLIADTGANTGRREQFTLYVIEEPLLGAETAAVAWSVVFSFSDSSKDCEAVAVDPKEEKILLLSKQDVPAVLYELPLKPVGLEPQVAARIGEVTTVLQPTPQEIKTKLDEHHAQLTAMDISADGSAVAVLTYRRLYFYEHSAGGSWLQALQSRPLIIEYPQLRQAEAVCFSADSRTLFVTSEKTPAPILKITLRGAP